MNLLDRKKIKDEIFHLMDEVQNHLKKDPNIDNFLDNNYALGNWENIISEEEYPIFLIAVLNNIRSKTIMDSILGSIGEQKKSTKIKYNKKSGKKIKNSFGEHPFN